MHKKRTLRFARTAKILTLIVILLQLQGCIVATGVAVGALAGGTALVMNDRRTVGTLIEDQSIELKASRKLNTDGEPGDIGHLNVTAYNTVVLLTGQVPNQSAKQRAEDLVNSVSRVKRIHNELRVSGTSSLLTRSSDKFISGKIKSQLLTTKEINMSRIKIITENGVVYLMGLVTPKEADIATQISRHTGGVQKVVQLFEIVASNRG